MPSAREALPWFAQANSDLRIARLLLVSNELIEPLAKHGVTLQLGDRGCHCVAMCSQTVEKSIKGYLIVNGAQPGMDHRPDKYVQQLLRINSKLLRHKSHRERLSGLFDLETKSVIRQLFELTPGGMGGRNDVPNTEYPWTQNSVWVHAPVTTEIFVRPQHLERWVRISDRVHTVLYKLAKSASQGSPP